MGHADGHALFYVREEIGPFGIRPGDFSEKLVGCVKGAIFDLDGTLLDSMPLWDTICSSFLRSIGIAPPEKIDRVLKAMSLRQAAEYLIDRFHLPESAEELIARVNDRVSRKYQLELPLKPGVRPFLRELAGSGVKMCVATATESPLAKAALWRLGMLPYFEFVLCCSEAGSGKDKPYIYEQALLRLGTDKKETVVFEDALHAVKTAKSAGFRVVGVEDASAGTDAEAIRKIADGYIRSFGEVDIRKL